MSYFQGHDNDTKPISQHPGARSCALDDGPGSLHGSMAELHELAWRKQDQTSLFRPLLFTRDVSPIPDVEIPHHPMMLVWDYPGLARFFGVDAIFIREEYTTLLRDIVGFVEDPFVFPEPNYDGVDESLGNDETSKQDDDVNAPKETTLGLMQNPFDRPLPLVNGNADGAIVTGSSGIGKSLFLIYVLTLRLLARKPTLLQLSKSHIFLFSSDGAFRIPEDGGPHLECYIPRDTWFLCDSERDLSDVPMALTAIRNIRGGFILHVASPRPQGIEWNEKAGTNVPVFWLAPWTLGEAILARDVQRRGRYRPSEPELATFFSRYAPLARLAFAYASCPGVYETNVIEKLGSLNRTKLRDILQTAHGVGFDDRISRHLLVASPASNNRRFATVAIPTKHLIGMLLARLRRSDMHAALHLYHMFIDTRFTRGGAGQLLKAAFLEELPRGGEWPVKIMKKQEASSTTTHFRADEDASRQCLRLGYSPHPVSVENPISSDAIRTTSSPLPREVFFSSFKQLRDGFYMIPDSSSSQPSYDAFVYNSELRAATIFQTTVSGTHVVDIECKALQDLTELGVETVDLVVVTCLQGAQNVYLSGCCNGSRLRNIYRLELYDGKP